LKFRWTTSGEDVVIRDGGADLPIDSERKTQKVRASPAGNKKGDTVGSQKKKKKRS